jgi:LysM repeat protein
VDRSRVTRWAAPAAFLAAITIGAIVVRAGFEHGRHRTRVSTTTATPKTTTKTSPKHTKKRPQVRTYTVQSGDTFGTIATKEGTTVAKLEQLNPDVSPTALRVGQKIRVQ